MLCPIGISPRGRGQSRAGVRARDPQMRNPFERFLGGSTGAGTGTGGRRCSTGSVKVSPVEMTKLLGNAGLTLSTEILRIQGKLRYVNDWDREISDRLKSRNMPAVPPVVIRRHARTGEHVEHRLVITDVPAGRIRRFDYAKCKAQHSLLYHHHVTLTAPVSPLTLTFVKAEVWDQIRSQGWLSCATDYDARRAVDSNWSYRHQVTLLSDVRQTRAQLKAAEMMKRIALAELITERDSEPRPYTHNGGILRVRSSTPHQRIALDFAEEHPELRKFVTYNARKAYTKVEFRPIGADFEGDDEDEDAVGIWSF